MWLELIGRKMTSLLYKLKRSVGRKEIQQEFYICMCGSSLHGITSIKKLHTSDKQVNA